MERSKDFTCPRCEGGIPSNENRGAYMGALSRVADIEICSLCGEDEAVAIIFTNGEFNGLVPQDEWPISREEMEKRMAPLMVTKEMTEKNAELLRSLRSK